MRRALFLLLAGLCFAGSAWAQSPPCSTGTSIPVSLSVPNPCPNQPLTLFATACGPCVDLRGWTRPPGGPIQVHAAMDLANCMLTICEPDSLAIPLGAFAPGHHTMTVDLLGTVLNPDSTSCSVIEHHTVTFDVPFTCEPPPPPPPCSTGVQVPVSFSVPNPCPGRPLELVAEACGPCVDLLGWSTPPGQPFQLNAVMDPQRCMLDICVPERVAVPIGTFTPGQYTVSVRTMATIVGPDSALCSVDQFHLVDFTVPVVCDTTAPCSTTVTIPVAFRVPDPCPGRPLILLAQACGPCVDLGGWIAPPGETIQVLAEMDLSRCLNRICEIDSLAIPLGTFAPGHHVVVVEVRGAVRHPDGTLCPVVQRHEVAFDVPFTCEPPPPPGPLPYVDVIRIGPPPPCPGCPPGAICPHREIPFYIAGHLPGSCYQFRGLQLLPNPSMSPLPQPPIARVLIAVNDCLGMPCTNFPVPWEARALLPGLPAGDYRMMVEVAEISWCDSTNAPDTLYTTLVPFTVAQTCSLPPAPACYLHGWRHLVESSCDAWVGAGTPARVVFEMMTQAPIAGVQGRLALEYPGVFDPAINPAPALRIASLRPIGPASEMHLFWQPTANGATFVLYSDDGAPIQPVLCDSTPCPIPQPVLEVILAPLPGTPIPRLTLVHARDLIVSDGLGREVPQCPTFAPISPARVCAGRSCDFNADGSTDVRDLVLMVRCIRGTIACPDTSRGRFDCNGDGVLGVDDVLCCARVILHGRAPDGTTPRLAPELQVKLGAPVASSTGVDLPVRIRRADLVGAARLVFTYPAGYDQVQPEILGDAGGWLSVSEAADGEMLLGLIATGPEYEMATDLDFVLHFRSSTSGASLTSVIELAEQEFAGRDGALLMPSAPNTGVPGAAARLALSEARPNPFTRETRFVLGLSQASDVEIAVFDLGGRRVATLHRGALAAGEHPFRWDGTRDGGARAGDGVYFYRAIAGSASATRKLVLLRGR